MYILREIKTIVVPVLKKKKTRDEKVGAFSVIIDNYNNIITILNKANAAGLTTPKLQVCPTKKESTITFFYKGQYDVDYVDSKQESIDRNLVPRLSAKRDSGRILRMIRLASEEKKTLRKELGVRGYTLRQLLDLKRDLKKQYKNKIINLNTQKVKEQKAYGYPCEKVYVDVASHYVQIGTQFIAKNPNDRVLLKVR